MQCLAPVPFDCAIAGSSNRSTVLEGMLNSQHTRYADGTTNSPLINGEMVVGPIYNLSLPDDLVVLQQPVAQILEYLTERGCDDVTARLNPNKFSVLPVSTGGAGNIYGARLVDQTKAAIKCLRLRFDSSDESRKDLRRAAHELYVWSKCLHPNVLELTGVAIFHGQIAMVSPWMEKGTVTWFVSQNPQADRHSLCTQIGEGVAYLHAIKIVHGDLKGANILVSNDGTPKITDFGTASMGKYTLQFDKTTGLPGMTLRWAAPELVMGESEHTTQTDIYALGMTYLEVITGSEPYRGIAEPAIMWKIVQGVYPARQMESMPTACIRHDRMWSLLEACWAFHPQDRPSALQVYNQMERMAVREPNYGSISDVLYVLGTFGYNDWTGVLLDSYGVTRLETYADYDEFQVTIENERVGVLHHRFKCPRDDYFKDQFGAAQYVLRELYIWSKCDHPNISKPFGVAQYRGRLAVIQPLFTTTYDEYLRMHPNADRLQLCVQLADAVVYLHNRRIIHGNLSAFNVFVSGHGEALLDDFSNAILEWDGVLFSKDSPPRRYYYARRDAPERYKHQRFPTREADIWALGNVILAIITGQVSHSNPSFRPPPRLTPYDFQNPRGERLWAFLQVCWSIAPEDRPNALQVLNELKDIANMPSNQDRSECWML